MEENESLFEKIILRIKKYIKWYIYPFIYFLVTGIVCLYAWYMPYPKGAVKIIFITISLIPSLLAVGIITLWIVVIVLLSLVSLYFKKKAPDFLIGRLFEKLTALPQDIEQTPVKKTYSFRKKFTNSLLYSFGTVLIISGLLLLVWIARPYFSLLLSSSKIVALEEKVAFGHIQDNRIIIPSVLIDAPILEGIDGRKLSQGVCHVSNSPFPGEGGNCIIEGHNLAEFGFWKPQSFFSLLELVEKGTPIYVFYNGRKYVYKVKDKIYRNISNPKLYDNIPGERLTLITCVSTWSPTIYTNRRTVVIAYPEALL